MHMSTREKIVRSKISLICTNEICISGWSYFKRCHETRVWHNEYGTESRTFVISDEQSYIVENEVPSSVLLLEGWLHLTKTLTF